MADNWYYVQKGNRQGPVAIEVIEAMIGKQELKAEDYVWKKGFENWKKIKEVPELLTKKEEPVAAPDVPPAVSKIQYREVRLSEIAADEKQVFVRIGLDRGGAPAEYGPFSPNQLKQLYKENRINGKTAFYAKGMKDYMLLADIPDYQQFFEELPPVIQEEERRSAVRKPFVARLFVQNNKNVYEGICRDISIGGMQVLMDEFNGKAGDRITINVHPENTDYHFTASGEVVRILEGNTGFSFRFHGLSDDAKRSIDKYLQEN